MAEITNVLFFNAARAAGLAVSGSDALRNTTVCVVERDDGSLCLGWHTAQDDDPLEATEAALAHANHLWSLDVQATAPLAEPETPETPETPAEAAPAVEEPAPEAPAQQEAEVAEAEAPTAEVSAETEAAAEQPEEAPTAPTTPPTK